MDSVSDCVSRCRHFKVLTIVDCFSKGTEDRVVGHGISWARNDLSTRSGDPVSLTDNSYSHEFWIRVQGIDFDQYIVIPTCHSTYLS